MQETLLLIELEVQEFCVDLRALSKIILCDLGATLQIFRAGGTESAQDGDCPRIEDCITTLGLQGCKDVLTADLKLPRARSKAVAQLWRHSRSIAESSKQIAERTKEVDPDQAYLAGLCHSVGSLPDVLGWSGDETLSISAGLVGAALTKEWMLPSCVVSYFDGLYGDEDCSPITEIVQAAHRWSGERSDKCAFTELVCPQLLWAV
jgi:hypothetical protein